MRRGLVFMDNTENYNADESVAELSKENSNVSNQLIIYVDESGDTFLNNYDDSSKDYYVISAIITTEESSELYKDAAKHIVSKYAHPGELKSSSIGDKSKRRKEVLKDIREKEFLHYSLVVDKTLIWKDSGLRFKPSFYKFLHDMFYTRIHRTFFGIRVIADWFGTTEFMSGFSDYITNKNDLFEQSEFESSKKEPLLQIADVVAGSIRRVFNGQDSNDLIRMLNYSSMSIEKWPPSPSSFYTGKTGNQNDRFNDLVRTIAIQSARKFVENNLNSELEEMKMKAQCVRYLLYRYYENPKGYVRRGEVTEHLNSLHGCNYSPHSLSTKILGPVKDDDVIIISTDKGIKIPFDTSDIEEWVSRVDSQVVPYLKRLSLVRKLFIDATDAKYDIVEKDVFPDLLDYLNY
ncbi:MAG: DUF3800 domain-containing protein [Calditrichaeota bacterium]|nr:DUF3800 domain-containing protein [Calditrichota bacterium]